MFISIPKYYILLVHYRKPVILLLVIESGMSTLTAWHVPSFTADRDTDPWV